MLRRLAFTNFKSWPQAELTLAPITGLFGTNSSGKTSILQFLLLLKQTKEATERAVSRPAAAETWTDTAQGQARASFGGAMIVG